MSALRITTHQLPLKHRFTISRGSVDVQPTMIVELEHNGVRGYGEATSNDYYGQTIEHMAEVLSGVAPQIERWNWTGETPAEWWDELHAGPLQSESFAHCALDQAAWDLWSRIRGEPLWQAWNLDPATAPASNFTIGIDDPETMAAKLREEPGWPCYKIKLGTPRDVEIVERLRRETDATFRVDANCGWTEADTPRLAEALVPLGVEFIGQPLPADQWSAMVRLCPSSPLPFAADESCQQPADVARCEGHFHIVNIKLVKCGGLTPARRMIEDARARGLKTMVGCMTESTVGIAAIAQLLPMLDYVDMDGANLLAKDIASGPRVVRGHCKLNTTPGFGVELTEAGERLL
ncbi:MAG: dipeptide epimerase [Planctomycetales bacterium]|nr:dipeptide epimerase [Planctomycetales bacterium]